MTTLEQQIAHFRDYWKVPQEDIDKLIDLAIQDNSAKQIAKREEILCTVLSKMKANNIYNKETHWGTPVGNEIW